MPTIIFDLDGTIANLWPIERITLARIAKEFFGIPEETAYQRLDSAYNAKTRSLRTLLQRCIEKRISNERFVKLYQNVQAQCIRQKKYPILIPLIPPSTIQECSRENTLALVTGSYTREAQYVLRVLNIQRYFKKRLIITADDMNVGKESGIPFQQIMKKTKGPWRVIGDSESDKAGAMRCNITFINAKEWQC